MRELYARGFDREQVLGLYRFIDWVLQLPRELDAVFWQQIQADEEARGMPYITSVERLGRAEGHIAGLREGVALAVEVKFGAEGADVAEALRRGASAKVVERLARGG